MVSLCLAAPSALASLIPDSVREAAEARLAAGHYQSLIIGVHEDGRTEWARFGQLQAGGKPPSPDTLYEIGSLTKPFTAALLALAEEEGLLDSQDRVVDVAPAQYPLDERLGQEVALWQLATHVSGLPDTPEDLSPSDPSRLFEDYSEKALWDFFARHPLTSPPGSHFSYSNLGYALLGQLLAAGQDSDYTELLDKKITTPLGLESTAVAPKPETLDRLAPGFDYDLNRAPGWSWPAFQAAGALHSTPADLMRWLQAHLAGGDGPLPRALARLHREQLRLGDGQHGMGLGWRLLHGDNDEDAPIAWHSGRTAGHAAFAGFQPDQGRAVVALANTGNSLETLGLGLLQPERAIPPPAQGEKLDPQLAALYAGRYRLSPGFVVSIRGTDNGLLLRAPGRPTLRLYSLDGVRFFTRGVDSEIHFVENRHGTIEGLEIHAPHGRVQFAHRMEATDNPAPREVSSLPPEQLARRAGTYRADNDTEFQLYADTDRLMLTNGSGVAKPLYPAADGRFFHPSQPLELLFRESEDSQRQTLIVYSNGYRMEADRVDED